MKSGLRLMTASLAAAMFAGAAWGMDDKAKAPAADAEAPGCHGTAVIFVDTPGEAAKQAKKEEKLVFVLHVSGQFEDPGIT